MPRTEESRLTPLARGCAVSLGGLSGLARCTHQHPARTSKEPRSARCALGHSTGIIGRVPDRAQLTRSHVRGFADAFTEATGAAQRARGLRTGRLELPGSAVDARRGGRGTGEGAWLARRAHGQRAHVSKLAGVARHARALPRVGSHKARGAVGAARVVGGVGELPDCTGTAPARSGHVLESAKRADGACRHPTVRVEPPGGASGATAC